MRLLPVAVLALTLAGCGGSPSADRRGAADAWSVTAENRCEQLASFVASASQPDTVDGLELYARDVASYTRDGIAGIGRVPVPAGAEARAAGVLSALRTLEPELRALEASSRVGDRHGQVTAATRLRDRWRAIEPTLRAAGLRSCSGDRQGAIVADAVRAPIWVQRFAELQDAATRRVAAIGPVHPAQLPTVLRKVAGIADRTARRVAALEPPDSIDDTAYLRLLGHVSAAERALAGRIAAHDLPGARRAQRRLLTAVGRLARETDRLGVGTGHFPVPVAPEGSLAS